MPSLTVKVRKRANGKHTGYYLAPDGSWLSAGTYGDKEVARIRAKDAYDAARKTGWINPKGSKTILDNYFSQVWFPSLLVEAKTETDYKSCYGKHIKPTFGDREMGSILYTEVKTWLNNMEDMEIGRSTQRKAFVILNMIFGAALKDRLIPARPTDGIETRPIEEPEILIFTRKNFDAFLEKVPEYWTPLIQVAVDTGMRASELRALCPAQISLERSEIVINRATVVDSMQAGGERFVEKRYPKGKRSRTIKVERSTLKILVQEMVRRGLDREATDRIFVSPTGLPIAEEVNAAVVRACELAKVPRRTFKHLRSTKASWMLKDTRDLMAVKEYLGHRDLQTTQKYLAVVTDEETEAEVISLEDFLKDDNTGLSEAL